MYEEIENILVRTISPYEYEQLEELKKTYSEDKIIDAYKKSAVKNVNYVRKILQTKNKLSPEWVDKEFKDEPLDDNTKKEFDDFNIFLEDFRNGTN